MTKTIADDEPVVLAPARRIVNPVQRDVVTFLETSEETGGERTPTEVELVPGGGNAPTTTSPTTNKRVIGSERRKEVSKR